MARLGLRAGEVAAMQLEDIDWRAGEITVRGKGRRKDRLPLPSEVGEAIVEYLADGRPVVRDSAPRPHPVRTLPAHLSELDHEHRLSRLSPLRSRPSRRTPVAPRSRHRDAPPRRRPAGDRAGAAPVRPGHDCWLCQGRSCRVANGRPPLAGGAVMSGFSVHLEEYLQLRRALGHKLDHATRVLPRFVAFLDAAGARTITVELALASVRQPEADPSSSVWMHRMGAVRGFARHMSGIDPANEIPPLGLVTFRRRWRQPFIYSDADIVALMEEVPRLVPTPFRVASFQTMIGLLATTGIRVGEVIALTRADVDWGEGVITVRNSKFNKSRELPLDPTTVEALGQSTHLPRPSGAETGECRLLHLRQGDAGLVRRLFRQVPGAHSDLPEWERLTAPAAYSRSPPLFCRQHTCPMAPRGPSVGPLLPRLSTYLGHLTPGHTYWYLSAAPELLALAAARLEKRARR